MTGCPPAPGARPARQSSCGPCGGDCVRYCSPSGARRPVGKEGRQPCLTGLDLRRACRCLDAWRRMATRPAASSLGLPSGLECLHPALGLADNGVVWLRQMPPQSPHFRCRPGCPSKLFPSLPKVKHQNYSMVYCISSCGFGTNRVVCACGHCV